MADIKTGAIILAAGLSSRMDGFKPLLSIGSKTLLGHCISLFHTTGVDDIVVVTGHQTESLQQELNRYPCRSILNMNYNDGMFSSIQIGIRKLATETKAFFLLPVDIPLVKTDTIEKLIKAIEQDSSSIVFYPQYLERRGHPPLISCNLANAILSYEGQGGLRPLLKKYQQQTRNVSVEDPYILLDADTQNDLNILKKHYQAR